MEAVCEVPKVRAVFATVCKRCESLVGAEKVSLIAKSVVDNGVKNHPDHYVAYEDRIHKASFRVLNYVDSCRQC